MDTLGKRLAWAREQKGLTQEALAKLGGVSQSTIGNLEAGIRETARKIVDIAAALDVDPVWLANGKGSAPDARGESKQELAAVQKNDEEQWKLADDLLNRVADIIETYRLANPDDRERIDLALREARNNIVAADKAKPLVR